MYGDKGEVPEGEYTIPLGVADIKREGTDVTIVSFGKIINCLLYRSPSPRDGLLSRMPSSA